jgi:hypothetical protein
MVNARSASTKAYDDTSLAHSVVFFDPDIGLQTGTPGYMRAHGLDKYVMYADLSAVAARATDSTAMVVYQHLQTDVSRLSSDLGRRLRELKTHLAHSVYRAGLRSSRLINALTSGFILGALQTTIITDPHPARRCPRTDLRFDGVVRRRLRLTVGR